MRHRPPLDWTLREGSTRGGRAATIEASGYSVHFLMPEDDTEAPSLLGAMPQRAITALHFAEIEHERNGWR